MATDDDFEFVKFYSDGLRISARLWQPAGWSDGDATRPGIVSLHGYTGMTHIYGMDVPRRLAAEGYWVLAPDHRGFGRSEGQRGRMRPLEQAQDTYDAVSFFSTIDGVDRERLGVYGTSFGGANAIWAAAFDERIKVVVTSVGVTDGFEWMRTIRRPHEWYELRDRIDQDARRRTQAGEPQWLPMREVMISDPHTLGVWQNFNWDDDPYYVPEYDLESLEAALRYRPVWVAPQIAPRPVMVIYAELDGLVPPEQAFSLYEALGEPKKLVKLPGAHHYESYAFVSAAMHERGMAAAVAWFGQYL
ncbi:MAG: alpha/beta fold hydrolase [Nitriliruptorales bacterium]|nr:alpha/beta fold hydrolase [Nitriliruptorales bacterium]